jgi:glucose-6-phosphate isomerase
VGNFFATFIEVLEDRKGPSIEIEPNATSGDFLFGCLQGTREALWENHRASITLTVTRVDAQTIGALIALYERAVGLYASLVNINAYHQPGVEAGKQAATQFLALQQEIVKALKATDKPISVHQLAETVATFDQVETVYKIVRHMAANPRGIVLQGDLTQPDSIMVSFDPAAAKFD